MKSNNQLIPLSAPVIKGNEWKYVKECLDTGWVSSAGSYVERFEKMVAEYVGAKYAVATVNGTSALQVSLQIVGVEPDDEVMVPTLTFIAPVNVIRYLQGVPIFMDCDDFYNIDVEKTVRFIKEETIFRKGYTWNRRTKRRVSAVIPVHVYGHAVDLDRLMPTCKERNIKIVEDATESLGTYYTSQGLNNRYTGTIGDIGCYSFNGNKIITTGGGGMVITDDAEYAREARYLTTQASNDTVRYIHNEVGYNFRLTNLQAAMGVAQLERLPIYIEIKKKNYLTYKKRIDKIPGLHLAETPGYAESNYWFYCLQIDKDKYGKDQEALMAHLSVGNIQSRPIWHLNHLQEPYKDCQTYLIENAYRMQANTLNIPCSVDLKNKEISRINSLLEAN